MSWSLKCDRCGKAQSLGSLHEIGEVAAGWFMDRGQDRDLCPTCCGAQGEPTIINCKVGALVTPMMDPKQQP